MIFMRSVAVQPQKVVVVFGCLGPVLPSAPLPAPRLCLPALLLLLQQNNKCGSATRAVAWLNGRACVCVCVRRNERTGFAFYLLRLLVFLLLSLTLSYSALQFALVWLVYCGRLAGGVGQAGDTMEPLSLSLSHSHKLWLLPNLILSARLCCFSCFFVVVVIVSAAGVSA